MLRCGAGRTKFTKTLTKSLEKPWKPLGARIKYNHLRTLDPGCSYGLETMDEVCNPRLEVWHQSRLLCLPPQSPRLIPPAWRSASAFFSCRSVISDIKAFPTSRSFIKVTPPLGLGGGSAGYVGENYRHNNRQSLSATLFICVFYKLSSVRLHSLYHKATKTLVRAKIIPLSDEVYHIALSLLQPSTH